MGLSYFTRRYFRNHGYFLFLRLVICLNSAGSLARLRSLIDKWDRTSVDINDQRIIRYKCLKASFWNCTCCQVQSSKANIQFNVECYDVFIICRPSGERGSRNTRSRHLRSSYCCSVYPAVRNSYRALLRSSSIREPSDPPLRVIKRVFIFVKFKLIKDC
jgi:hypothetical protein